MACMLPVGVLEDQVAAQSGDATDAPLLLAVESFHGTSRGLERHVVRRDGSIAKSIVTERWNRDGTINGQDAEQAYLRSSVAPPAVMSASTVRVVDLFSGCGGMSLGVEEACRALGLQCDVRLAADFEPAASRVFAANFPHAPTVTADVRSIFDGNVGEALTPAERRSRSSIGPVSILMGGPPCQGHSDLNNRTRRRDGKNELYFAMVRAVEVLEPDQVFIENVPGALNDQGGVVQRSIDRLDALGYSTSYAVVDAAELGVPQRRRRLVLVASRTGSPSVEVAVAAHRTPQRDVGWAIRDLVGVPATSLVDTPCNSAPATRRRIEFLFDHDLHELPDSQRPPCHSNGSHSYTSIYGRLSWNTPSQTVTTGFYSMCMGRYVHPSERRTLTAHEAARLQFFPDFFDFSGVGKRGELATMIGNAVPSKLSYVVALELLR